MATSDSKFPNGFVQWIVSVFKCVSVAGRQNCWAPGVESGRFWVLSQISTVVGFCNHGWYAGTCWQPNGRGTVLHFHESQISQGDSQTNSQLEMVESLRRWNFQNGCWQVCCRELWLIVEAIWAPGEPRATTRRIHLLSTYPLVSTDSNKHLTVVGRATVMTSIITSSGTS